MASLGSEPAPQKICTFLWFCNKQALEAAKFYTSLFPDSKILNEGPMVVTFVIAGQKYSAFNGEQEHKFTPAVSLYVECEDQEEIDRYWNAFLDDGGSPMACGWLTDRFGLSWQIIPKILPKLMSDPDKEKVQRGWQAMRKMVKLDIAQLQAAHAGTA